MKINELKRIAKENDYELTKSLGYYKLARRSEIVNHYIIVDKVFKNKLWISIEDCCDERDFNMMKAGVEFAETPPEDREEEKKFYLKHRCLVQPFTYEQVFLNYDTNNDKMYVYDNKQTCLIQTKFTLKEIDEIKKKFNTDLEDFELVEVEE